MKKRLEILSNKVYNLKRKIVGKILKKCIQYLDKDNTLLAYSIGVTERKDYDVIVTRYYDDHYTRGTMDYYYNKEKETA